MIDVNQERIKQHPAGWETPVLLFCGCYVGEPSIGTTLLWVHEVDIAIAQNYQRLGYHGYQTMAVSRFHGSKCVSVLCGQ